MVSKFLIIAAFGLIYYGIDNPTDKNVIFSLIAVSSLLGILLVLPIGGADMPVVISLNSLSGDCCSIHRIYHQQFSIDSCWFFGWCFGSNLDLYHVQNMNRTLHDVLFKAFGGSGEKESLTRTKVGSDADEVAMMIDGAQKVIIVQDMVWLYHNVNTSQRIC